MSFADKCPHCEHKKCCFCGTEKENNEEPIDKLAEQSDSSDSGV